MKIHKKILSLIFFMVIFRIHHLTEFLWHIFYQNTVKSTLNDGRNGIFFATIYNTILALSKNCELECFPKNIQILFV